MARELSITFALNAALKGGFTAAFQTAAASARGVKSAVREMENSSTGKLGAAMSSQKEKIKGLSGSLKEAKATLTVLRTEAAAVNAPLSALTAQVDSAKERVKALSKNVTAAKDALANMKGQAHAAAASTSNLKAQIVAAKQKVDDLSGSLKEEKATLSILQAEAKAAGGATGVLADRIALTQSRINAFSGSLKEAKSNLSILHAQKQASASAANHLKEKIINAKVEIGNLSDKLKAEKKALTDLNSQAKIAGGATKDFALQIAHAEGKVKNLSGALDHQLDQWKKTTAEAATVGGSVRQLSQDYATLTARIERSRKLAGAIGANRAEAEALRNQRADLQGRLLSTAATTASVALPVKLAISAEDTFADLRKVMDAPEDVMLRVFADAQAMSSRTGKSFEDVITIMTSAAQAGLGKTREELLGVADQAVKMSIAWGVSAEQAGKSLATWRSSMGMTDEQAKQTADVINALSNAMNAEAGEIDQIFTRMGPMMASSGMATRDIAALATAFKAAGAQVEVSGTAMKNFSNVMVAGSAGLTDTKKNIYKFLEIDPNELQKQFHTDAKGAIIRVLEALKTVKAEERISVATMLFGQDSIAAISPLLGQLDKLKEAFKIANGEVTGSVDEEYANRMKTTATALSQMSQNIRNLGISAGKALLPAVGAAARGISTVVGHIGTLVERFPGLSSAVMIAGAGIASFAVGGLALGLVLNTVRTSVNSVRGVMLRLAASQATAAASTGAMSVATGAFGAASKLAGVGARFFAGGLRSILVATGVGAALVGLGFAVDLLIDNWDAVVAAMSSAWAWVTDTWGRLGVFFTELGNNLTAVFAPAWESIVGFASDAWNRISGLWIGVTDFFSGLWSGVADGALALWTGVTGAASWAYESVASVWTGAVDFFAGTGQAVAETFSGCWRFVQESASWAFAGVSSIWGGAVDFFSGAVNGISGVFSGLFDWLRDKFAWVFSALDAVSSFVGRITGAVTDAWNKAFGDDDKTAPATATAAATPAEPPLAPVAHSAAAQPAEPSLTPAAQSATEKPAAQIAKPDDSGKSYAEYLAKQKAAKGQSKKGSGSRGRGASGSTAGRGDSGPVTVVTLAGDNAKPQTVFIPAAASMPASPSSTTLGAPVTMPAVQAATKAADTPRALPQTPILVEQVSKAKKRAEQAPSIAVDLTQHFELMGQDTGAIRKVMESLKPDFEALVRRALEKIQSDRRRTAYAQ